MIELLDAPRHADYTLIERHFLQSEEGQAHQQYWLEQLRDAPVPPQLPPDRIAEADDVRAARVDVPLGAELVHRLRSVGSAHGASLVPPCSPRSPDCSTGTPGATTTSTTPG